MSLQIWLPLNGSLVNNGLSDLKFSLINTTNTTISTDSKFGKSYNNNSYSAGGITSDKSINLGQNQSMFCWFKFTTLNNNFSLGGGLVTQHNHSTNSGMGITIKYVSSTTGYISVNTGTGSARTYNTYCGTTLLQANTWYHGGYTYDGNNIKLYVNGVCENTISFTNMSVPANPIKVFIWSLSHQDYYFNGKLNDVRIYNHCLSLKEVKEISKALILHYPMNNSGLGFCNPNLLTGTTTGDGWSKTSFDSVERVFTRSTTGTSETYIAKSGVPLRPSTTYTLTADIKTNGMVNDVEMFGYDGNVKNVFRKMINPAPTEWTHYKHTFTTGNNSTYNWYSATIRFDNNGSKTSGQEAILYVKNIKLEEGSLETPYIPALGEYIFNSKYEIITRRNKNINTNLMMGNFSCTSSKDSYSSTGNLNIWSSFLNNIKNYAGRTLYFSYEVKSDGTSTGSGADWQKARFGIHGSFTYKKTGSDSNTTLYPFADALSIGKQASRYYAGSWTIPTDIDTIVTNLTFSNQSNPSGGFAKPASDNTNTWFIKNLKLELDGYTQYYSDVNEISNFVTDGIEILDVSGYNNHASVSNFYYNQPVYSSDSKIYRSSLYFNGYRNYIQTSRTMGWIFDYDFTECVWLKPTDSTRGIIFTDYNNTGAAIVSFEIKKDLKLRLYWNGTPDVSSTGAMTINTWNHVAVVKTSNKIKFYINGQPSGEYTHSSDLSSRHSSALFRLGDDTRGNSANTVSYKGYMNDFRFYGTALSPEDIKELYNTPISVDNQGNCYVKELVEEYE